MKGGLIVSSPGGIKVVIDLGIGHSAFSIRELSTIYHLGFGTKRRACKIRETRNIQKEVAISKNFLEMRNP
jgi:hypothetical protein